MSPKKQWYAVYTRSRWEKKVAELLTAKKIESYCPLVKTKKQWSDRKKIILEPLFTSYVFVNITDQEQLTIKQTDGIINFVHWLGKPAVIKNEEVEAIKNFLHHYQNVKLEKAQVNINDRVKIISGPLMQIEGDVIEVKNKSVKVYLPTLGFNMVADVIKSNIEIVNEPNHLRKITL
jgi:transcription antitermination factor NusG